jgi:hypothetical protein
MTASLLYRVASVLLVLFALGHTIGFRRVDPRWGVEAPIAALKSTRFVVQGFQRDYWGFYVGFGLMATLFFLFAAFLSWQFGGMPREALAAIPGVRWAFAAAFVGVTVLSWRYFFVAPVIFSVVITACLLLAAWLPGRA